MFKRRSNERLRGLFVLRKSTFRSKTREHFVLRIIKWAEGTESKKITGFDASKHTLLPIPLSEIQLNKDADLQQNPGY